MGPAQPGSERVRRAGTPARGSSAIAHPPSACDANRRRGKAHDAIDDAIERPVDSRWRYAIHRTNRRGSVRRAVQPSARETIQGPWEARYVASRTDAFIRAESVQCILIARGGVWQASDARSPQSSQTRLSAAFLRSRETSGGGKWAGTRRAQYRGCRNPEGCGAVQTAEVDAAVDTRRRAQSGRGEGER